MLYHSYDSQSSHPGYTDWEEKMITVKFVGHAECSDAICDIEHLKDFLNEGYLPCIKGFNCPDFIEDYPPFDKRKIRRLARTLWNKYGH